MDLVSVASPSQVFTTALGSKQGWVLLCPPSQDKEAVAGGVTDPLSVTAGLSG